jgi:hypothetical protein
MYLNTVKYVLYLELLRGFHERSPVPDIYAEKRMKVSFNFVPT